MLLQGAYSRARHGFQLFALKKGHRPVYVVQILPGVAVAHVSGTAERHADDAGQDDAPIDLPRIVGLPALDVDAVLVVIAGHEVEGLDHALLQYGTTIQENGLDERVDVLFGKRHALVALQYPVDLLLDAVGRQIPHIGQAQDLPPCALFQ